MILILKGECHNIMNIHYNVIHNVAGATRLQCGHNEIPEQSGSGWPYKIPDKIPVGVASMKMQCHLHIKKILN